MYKPAQYSKIREAMAEIYEDDEDLFGPSGLDKIAENAYEEEKTIYNKKKKNYQSRIQANTTKD